MILFKKYKEYFKDEYTEDEYIEHLNNLGTLLLIGSLWMLLWIL